MGNRDLTVSSFRQMCGRAGMADCFSTRTVLSFSVADNFQFSMAITPYLIFNFLSHVFLIFISMVSVDNYAFDT
jgi:hypothetical protein